MSQPGVPSRRCSIAEYLNFEDAADPKHEFWDGQVVEMAGGTFAHAQVGANLVFTTKSSLRGSGCDSYGSDLRVYVQAAQGVFYPDATIICGKAAFDAALPGGAAVTNPVVLFEALSPSTEKIDRTRKFSAYMRLESLREYVLVYTDQPRAETFFRQEDGTWLFNFVEGLNATLPLRSVGVALAMRDVYAGVEFEPADTATPQP